jgi:pyrroloquinoline quinone biosynthesis protein B
VVWRALKPGGEDILVDRDDETTDLGVQAVAVPGKPPLHLEGRVAPALDDNIGFRIRDMRSGRVLAYFSGVGRVTPELRRALEGASCVFLDGTFWSSDELPALAGGTRRAEDMAHWPLGGSNGSLAALTGVTAPRRILIHVNNTNPVLREDSPERALVTAAGWEVAHDGMEIVL